MTTRIQILVIGTAVILSAISLILTLLTSSRSATWNSLPPPGTIIESQGRPIAEILNAGPSYPLSGAINLWDKLFLSKAPIGSDPNTGREFIEFRAGNQIGGFSEGATGAPGVGGFALKDEGLQDDSLYTSDLLLWIENFRDFEIGTRSTSRPDFGDLSTTRLKIVGDAELDQTPIIVTNAYLSFEYAGSELVRLVPEPEGLGIQGINGSQRILVDTDGFLRMIPQGNLSPEECAGQSHVGRIVNFSGILRVCTGDGWVPTNDR